MKSVLRTLKRFFWLLTIISSLLALLPVLILLGMTFLFDPNDYKPQISQYVQDLTGRILVLEGDLKLSWFPWLGIEVNQARLSNAKGFADPTFAQLETAQVRVNVLALLQQRIEIDAVQLTGVTLFLTRTKEGHTNWEDFLKLGGTSDKTSSVSLPQQVKIGGIILQNAKVVWEDLAQHQHHIFSQVGLDTSPITFTPAPISFKLNAHWKSRTLLLNGQIGLSGQLSLDLDKNLYRVKSLHLSTNLKGDKIPPTLQPMTFQTDVNVEVDVNQQSLTFSSLQFQFWETILRGEVQIHKMFSNPGVSGQLQLAELKLPQLFKRLHLAPTSLTTYEKMFKTMAFEIRFQANPTELTFTQLRLQLDDNQVTIPHLTVNFKQPELQAKDIVIHALGMTLQAQLRIQNLFTQPAASGKLSMASVKPSQVLSKLANLNVKISQQWPDFLKTVALETQFAGNAKEWTFENVTLQLDDNRFQTSKLFLNVAQQTLETKALSLQLWGIPLQTQFQVKQLFQSPTLSGKVTVATFNPQPILKRLGYILPSLSPPFTLMKAGLQVQIATTDNEVKLTNLQLSIDDQQLNSSQVTFNWVTDGLTLEQVTLHVLGLTVHSHLQLTQVSSAPTFQGTFELAEANPRQFLQRLGQPIPTTADPKVLNTVTLETQVQGDLSKLVLDKLKIRLDNSQLQGSLRIQEFNRPVVMFDLNIDGFEVDRYLPPKSSAVKKGKSALSPSSQKTVSPLDYLRSLTLQGKLTVNHLNVVQIKIKDVNLTVSSGVTSSSQP